MKGIKKFLTGILAATMIMGASITAFAAADDAAVTTEATSTPSITINPANDTEGTESLKIDYTAYQILEATVGKDAIVNAETGAADAKGTAAYYVTKEARANQISGTGLFNVTKVDGEDKWYVELKNPNTSAEAIIAAFEAESFDLSAFEKKTFTKKADDANATLTGISAGYYYITSSLGAKAAVQTLSGVTINEKNTYPTLQKEDDKVYAEYGEVVNYTVTVDVPLSVAEKEIKIVDTITNGLTLNTNVTVSGGVDYSAAEFKKNEAYTEAGKTQYIITIPAATVSANKGKKLVFTYTATVNKDAVVMEPEKNAAHLEYDNFVTPDSEVDVKTLAFDIRKVDSVEQTVLAGAEFKLFRTENGADEIKVVLKEAASATNDQTNVYRLAEENETGVVITAGKARIEGLNNATYYLEETKAPTGYNILNGRVALDVDEATSAKVIDQDIENSKGATLPSTGGIGTTIFYIIGGLLIVAAVVFFVVRRKSDAE